MRSSRKKVGFTAHLRNIENVLAGVLSIDGAETFDGIVLSGIIVAYLP
jgi:uncharacterized membrane protein